MAATADPLASAHQLERNLSLFERVLALWRRESELMESISRVESEGRALAGRKPVAAAGHKADDGERGADHSLPPPVPALERSSSAPARVPAPPPGVAAAAESACDGAAALSAACCCEAKSELSADDAPSAAAVVARCVALYRHREHMHAEAQRGLEALRQKMVCDLASMERCRLAMCAVAEGDTNVALQALRAKLEGRVVQIRRSVFEGLSRASRRAGRGYGGYGGYGCGYGYGAYARYEEPIAEEDEGEEAGAAEQGDSTKEVAEEAGKEGERVNPKGEAYDEKGKEEAEEETPAKKSRTDGAAERRRRAEETRILARVLAEIKRAKSPYAPRSPLEEAQRAARKARELEHAQRLQRERTAHAQLLPLLPFLTTEQAVAALAMHADNLERAVQFLLDTPPEELERRLASFVAADERKRPVFPPVVRHAQAAVLPHAPEQGMALCRVSKVDGAAVSLVPLFDRNLIPLDPRHTPAVMLPLSELLRDEVVRVVSADEESAAEADLRERVLEIVMQDLGDDELTPLSVVPPVSLHAYQLDYAGGVIRRLSHSCDGRVLFQAHSEDGDFGLFGNAESPIELFTEPLGARALHVAHMHIDDVRDDVTLDSINLTGSQLTPADCREFRRDAAGRALSYRVIAKEGRILAVLYQLAGRALEAAFVEVAAPRVGALVWVAEREVLGIVRGVQRGLVVAAGAEDADAACRERGALPEGDMAAGVREIVHCARKHPEQLGGAVEIEVVMRRGALLLPTARLRAPVCMVRGASEAQRSAYEAQVVRFVAESEAEALRLVAELEAALTDCESNSGTSESRRGAAARLTPLRASLLRALGQPLLEGRPALAECRARLDRAEKRIRSVTALLRR